MSRASVVVECDEAELQLMAEVINSATGGGYAILLATGADSDLIHDVFEEPELGAGAHLADLRPDGWVMEHSLRCRRTREMTDCPMIALVDYAYRDGAIEHGRWYVELIPGVGFTTPSQLSWTPEDEA